MIEGSNAATQIREIAKKLSKEEIQEIAAKANTMTREEMFKVFEKNLRATIERNAEKDPDMEITEATTMQDMGLDSLDTVELIMDVEETLDIEIDDEELKQCKTVSDLLDLADKTLKEKPLKEAAIAKYKEQKAQEAKKADEEFIEEMKEEIETIEAIESQFKVPKDPTKSVKDKLPKEKPRQLDKTKLK